MNGPRGVAVSPGGAQAYVTDGSSSSDGNGEVSVIDTATQAVTATITLDASFNSPRR
jgi:YVTN family beta-propeller protein